MVPIQRKSLPLILLATLVLVGLGVWTQRPAAADASPGAAATKPALTVTLTQARAGSLPVRLAANGNISAWQEASVGAEANGLRVQALLVQVGDWVQRGQLLASFAAEGVQADVALARAALAEAQANALEATANAGRARAVQGSGALSTQQISQYLTQELTAQARVALAQAQLDAQLLRLKHTQVLAPDAGIISARSATLGAVLGAGVEMFRLIRQGRLEWRAELTSAELGRVTAGTGVLVTAPDGSQIKGRVRRVAPTVDAQTRNGLVYVDLLTGGPSVTGLPQQKRTYPAGGAGGASGANGAGGVGGVSGASATGGAGGVGGAATWVAGSFKPGMFARGEFDLGQSSALTVLQSAVLVREGFSFVMRVGPDHRVSQRKVLTGRVLGEQVEILSGLTPDDRLVASGASFLSDGDLVRVVAAPTPDFKQKSTATPVKPALTASK